VRTSLLDERGVLGPAESLGLGHESPSLDIIGNIVGYVLASSFLRRR
jgi:hypothetical protein